MKKISESLEPDLFRIDWRRIKEVLADKLRTGSGVVHVRVDQLDPPETTFVRTLTEAWLAEHWPNNELVIVYIEPNDPELHHLSGITSRIVKNCGLTPNGTGGPQASSVDVLKDIRAGGNIEVRENDVRIEINHYSDWRSPEPLDILRAQLAGFLSQRRLVLIFRETHRLAESLRIQLGRDLWKHCLARFEDPGVLLICLYEDGFGLETPSDAGFPPPAQVTIDLPSKIDADDEPHAVEDVVEIALARGWFETAAEARAFADGQVGTAEYMRKLHVRLRVYGARHARLGFEGAGS